MKQVQLELVKLEQIITINKNKKDMILKIHNSESNICRFYPCYHCKRPSRAVSKRLLIEKKNAFQILWEPKPNLACGLLLVRIQAHNGPSLFMAMISSRGHTHGP